MRVCRYCGADIGRRPKWSRYCNAECSQAWIKQQRREKVHTLTCHGCGAVFGGKSRKPKWCDSCRKAKKRKQARRRAGAEPDRQQKQCTVCGAAFVSKRYSQIYCGSRCRTYMLNKRRIDKARRWRRAPDPSPEQIRQRCLAIQSAWDENTRMDRLRGDRRHP